MLLDQGGKVDVGAEVSPGQQHIVLLHVPAQVVGNALQGLHIPVVARPVHRGQQQVHPPAVADHVPGTAAAQVFHQTLEAVLHDHAHVEDPGVHHAAEGEVHQPEAPAEGQGGGGALLAQLAQVGVVVIGVNDAVYVDHCGTSSLE